jgi:DNA polymerase-3 subunit beta
LLTLASQAAEIGESKVELPLACEDQGPTISLDPQFLSDFLRVLAPEAMVHIELTDSESAAVLHTDDGSMYLVMPLSRDR